MQKIINPTQKIANGKAGSKRFLWRRFRSKWTNMRRSRSRWHVSKDSCYRRTLLTYRSLCISASTSPAPRGVNLPHDPFWPMTSSRLQGRSQSHWPFEVLSIADLMNPFVLRNGLFLGLIISQHTETAAASSQYRIGKCNGHSTSRVLVTRYMVASLHS